MMRGQPRPQIFFLEPPLCCLLANSSETNPIIDRHMLYAFQPRKFRHYWIEADQISTRYGVVVSAVNAPAGVAILQSVAECHCDD